MAKSTPGDYDAVREDIKALLHQPEYDDGSAGPVLVRLAWCVVPLPPTPRGAISASTPNRHRAITKPD